MSTPIDPTRLQVLAVDWLDACAYADEWDKDPKFKPNDGLEYVRSVGFLVKETPVSVVITRSVCSDGAFDAVLVIPVSCIVKKVLLP